MKFYNRFIYILLFALLPASAVAQVTVDIRIDSLQMFIGQQTGLTLDVTCNSNQHPVLPALSERSQLVPGVEVVKVYDPDTQMLNDNKRMLLTQRYIITSFDSALYYLPPLEVIVDTTHYKSKSLALQVYTVPVDTIHLEEYFGTKGIEDAPFSWDDWKSIVYGSLLIIVLLIITFAMLVWLKQGNPIIRIIRHKVKLPPHQVAMSEIERIKEEKTWASDDSKEYYTQLTDTLRTYIQDRYGFRAMDMTSGEIIERLTAENNEEALDELRKLFQTADLVKFAKHTPLLNENDANLVKAVDFVNQTKIEEPADAKPQPTEITIIEKRSLRSKIVLGAGIALLGCALLCSVAYVVSEIYSYFF